MADLTVILIEFARQHGYVGVFFASLAGSVVPFLSVPYRAYFQAARFFIGANELATTAVVAVLTVVITVLLARAKWELAYQKHKSGGVRGVLSGTLDKLGLGTGNESDSS